MGINRVIDGPMSDEMAWSRVYELAMTIAEEHGAVIPDSARQVGPYAFTQVITKSPEQIGLTWNGRGA